MLSSTFFTHMESFTTPVEYCTSSMESSTTSRCKLLSLQREKLNLWSIVWCGRLGTAVCVVQRAVAAPSVFFSFFLPRMKQETPRICIEFSSTLIKSSSSRPPPIIRCRATPVSQDSRLRSPHNHKSYGEKAFSLNLWPQPVCALNLLRWRCLLR